MNQISSEVLYDVLVDERVNTELTSHENVEYTSPPHRLDAALALAGLLGAGRLTGPGVMRVAIAGGCRTVTLRPSSTDEA